MKTLDESMKTQQKSHRIYSSSYKKETIKLSLDELIGAK